MLSKVKNMGSKVREVHVLVLEPNNCVALNKSFGLFVFHFSYL